MKAKFIILFSLSFLLLTNCSSVEGNLFDRILSKMVRSFSPKTEKKAELVNLITGAEENKQLEPKKTEVEAEAFTLDTLETVAEALHWEKIYYSDREKPDPFRPLILESKEREKKINVDLAKLVGVIWGKNGYLALLKEGNLGYVLKEGDKVIDGRVLKISEESIMFLLSRFGEQNRVTLQLKKER